MRCDGCLSWTVARKTVYSAGYEVETYRAPEGKGHCEHLGIDTAPEFGCAAFAEGTANQVIVSQKMGAPWEHWIMIKCPDCGGVGSSNDRPDDRCAGTGNVRLYDDGVIGDERTRKHPKEVAASARPQCQGCGRPVEADWLACPACGRKVEAPAKPEVVPLDLPNT